MSIFWWVYYAERLDNCLHVCLFSLLYNCFRREFFFFFFFLHTVLSNTNNSRMIKFTPILANNVCYMTALNLYSKLPRAPELEPHHRILFGTIPRTAIIKVVLPLCRGYRQCILSPHLLDTKKKKINVLLKKYLFLGWEYYYVKCLWYMCTQNKNDREENIFCKRFVFTWRHNSYVYLELYRRFISLKYQNSFGFSLWLCFFV